MKKNRKKKKSTLKTTLTVILVVILVLLTAAVGGGMYGALKVAGLETNYPNVSIDGMDVGGMTKDETAALLNDNGWEKKISTPLTVTMLDGYSFELMPKLAGTGVAAETLAQQAFEAGRGGNIIENFLSYAGAWIGMEKLNVVSTDQTADRDYIASCVDGALKEIDALVNVEDEYVIDEENAELRLKKGAGQIGFDRNDLIETVAAALEAGESEMSYTRLSSDLACPDFQAIYDAMPHDAQDAYITDDGTFTVVDEIVSCDFDVEAAVKAWNDAEPAEEIVIPLEISEPEVTGDTLRERMFGNLLGACTSYYPNSNDNRRNNLRLATSKIDGMILYPGDVFSYNTVVGARTEEAGFLPAAAYVNGEEKEEIGGGACQVSSTLYSATLFAFLETVERENHYFAVTYLQLGTDATVTIPTDGGRAIDFKFRNNRNYPIKLVGRTDNEESSITFEIWGMLEDDDYMPIEFDNSYNGQYPCDVKLEKADPNRPGYVIRLVHDTYSFGDEIGSGYRTVTWRKVYDEEGNLVHEEMTNLLNAAGQHTMDTYYFHNT